MDPNKLPFKLNEYDCVLAQPKFYDGISVYPRSVGPHAIGSHGSPGPDGGVESTLDELWPDNVFISGG
ncbi:hypothetical protein L195_g052477 [Trifolium pratense]|uniref:Uncharacterized protein n=1 Tax=Trifolium pratense TaxID=57577 RepID=A0A2K3K5C0_TRIPR|nr:hypothetical protein L195_g052477 [Trifolium pratense]